MKRTILRRPGVSLIATGVIAALGALFCAPTAAQGVPQTWAVHAVADHTDDHHGRGHDSGDDGVSGHPDKSEPTRSGLRGAGPMRADLTNPGTAVNGLASVLAQVALSPNHTIVQSEYLPVAAGQISDFEVPCPYPFKVVNGGESNSGTNVRLTRNYPVTTPNSSGWHVRIHNDDPDSRLYRVYAECINGLTQYLRVTHPDQEIAPGAYARDSLGCPPGTYALGGGFSTRQFR